MAGLVDDGAGFGLHEETREEEIDWPHSEQNLPPWSGALHSGQAGLAAAHEERVSAQPNVNGLTGS